MAKKAVSKAALKADEVRVVAESPDRLVIYCGCGKTVVLKPYHATERFPRFTATVR